MTVGRFTVEWQGGNHQAQRPADPKYPEGVIVDTSKPGAPRCSTELPYPAPECGWHKVTCEICGLKVGVTAAGRADDPRALVVPCKSLVRV